MALYYMMSEPDIETALRFPWTSIGSDAGAALKVGGGDDLGLPHPRACGNAVRVIAHYVKEVNGVVTIDHGKHTGAKAGQVMYGPGRGVSASVSVSASAGVSAQTIPN